MHPSFEMLNKVVATTTVYYEEHERKTSFCDARKELRNHEEYFTLICNQDITTEENLNRQLQNLIVEGATGVTPAAKDNAKLSLLCMNGHIAKLEHRRSVLAIFIPALALTMSIIIFLTKIKEDVPVGIWLIVLIFLCILPFGVVMANIDKRIFVLRRAAEHFKLITERD